MGTKATKATKSKELNINNIWCITYLLRIGVFVPNIATSNIHDFYRAQIDDIAHIERNKYKPIAIISGYILHDCIDHTVDFVRMVNIITMLTKVNWYHAALQFCQHNFDLDMTHDTCLLLRKELSDIKTSLFDNSSDVWYYMNLQLHKYEQRLVPQFKNNK